MIDKRIEQTSVLIKELKLSQLRLVKDGELSWLLLIPRREGIVEILDLSDADQATLGAETMMVARVLRENTECDKLNIGSLGNIVSQLHIHVIARRKNDRAWPGAIWGTESRIDFEPEAVSYWQKLFN